MRVKSALLFLLFAASAWVDASASTVLYKTDPELIARSERVVHARVVAHRTERGGPQDPRIYTVTTLAIIEDFTGGADRTIEVRELGGVLDNEVTFVGGRVEYPIGQEIVVCLERGRYGLRSVAMNLSKFDVAPGEGGGALKRRLRDTRVERAPAVIPERSLSEFRELARQVTGRASRRFARSTVGESTARVAQPATFLGLRWAEADSAIPVTFYRNATYPAPLYPQYGDGTTEILTSLAAWTDPTSASIILQYGGTTTQGDLEGPWGGLPSPAGLITFEDPNGDVPFYALAIGGGHGTSTFTSGFVIFQRGIYLEDSFKQPLDFSRVMTHEIGHAIGLGHTQEDGSVPDPTANVMYSACCYYNTPVPPALGPDDLAGLSTLYSPSTVCTYTVSPTTASVGSGATVSAITVTTQNWCSWSASSNAGFLSILSGHSGTGSGTVNYSVAPNPSAGRAGTLTVAGQTVTIAQSGTGPMMSVDKSSLAFGATTTGLYFATQTSAQLVRLSQSGSGAVTWTATSSKPWLLVSPASGAGGATLSVSVSTAGGLWAGTDQGTITISFSGASNPLIVLNVSLTQKPVGSSAIPVGVVDTPIDNTTGVTGAVPFTGWALDDIEIADVTVCRNAVTGEAVAADARCGGTARIFVGTAVFIDGARPDVQAAYPTYPKSSQAGWGFMVLTNMLPNLGNGTFVFSIYARDRDAHAVALGTRTLTCANASATRPFGTIDTPGQGDTVAGASYVNFGWALTQSPKIIPTDGSTITVWVDGVAQGSPSYNHYRSDIATLFPGLANSNGAVGFKIINTTTLSNGLHTIVWTATDSGGQTAGLGSRFFRVANGGSAVTAAASQSVSAPLLSPAAVDALDVDRSPILGRRGWEDEAPWRSLAFGPSGRAVIRGEEIDRIEVRLTESGVYTGYLRVGDELSPLPVGSRLDRGEFVWSPGVGFVGTYDLVFVRNMQGQAVSRRELRIVLRPKGSGHVGPQVVIDRPTPGSGRVPIDQPFRLAGWAADADAGTGTGIDALHVWAYPVAGGRPVFLGVASDGGARSDVGAVHGEQFRESGFGLTVHGLATGDYDLAVFPWSNVSGGFAPAKVVRVTVR